MFVLLHSLSILLSIFYVLLFIDYALLFFRDDPFAKKTVSFMLRFTIILHFAFIVLRTIIYAHIPLASVFEVFTVLSLAIILIYLYVESVTKVKTTGFFIIPFVLLFQLVSTMFDTFSVEVNHLLTRKFFILHVISAIGGYSAITIAAIYGILYLMLYHDIKSSRFGIIYSRLPSLEILYNMNYKSLGIGFILISGALVLGSLWSSMSIGWYWNWEPKIISVLAIWLIIGFGIFTRKCFGFSRKRLAYISLFGFMIMLFSLIVVNLYITGFHEFV